MKYVSKNCVVLCLTYVGCKLYKQQYYWTRGEDIVSDIIKIGYDPETPTNKKPKCDIFLVFKFIIVRIVKNLIKDTYKKVYVKYFPKIFILMFYLSWFSLNFIMI